jgi:hypothetical protein
MWLCLAVFAAKFFWIIGSSLRRSFEDEKKASLGDKYSKMKTRLAKQKVL